MLNADASLYHDFSGLAELKYQAREDQAGSTAKVARQFESLFVQMMVKQMRQASFCLLYTSPSPRDRYISRMPSSA